MLERLIAILNRNSLVTLDQLAGELNTTPEMIAQLIQYLERNKRLKQIGGDCTVECSGCYLASACAVTPQSRVWQN